MQCSAKYKAVFSRIMRSASTQLGHVKTLKAAWLDTLLGPMMAIGDEQDLYLLEFVERRDLERGVERLRQKTKSIIIPGETWPISSIASELAQYFEGKLKEFKTPLIVLGSPFQKRVWEELVKIPYGQTLSYLALASTIGRPSAFRAVAQANGANQFAIIIPCHRIINTNGNLAGYAGGLMRKQWLINHERQGVSAFHL